jgi:hypothetical protein
MFKYIENKFDVLRYTVISHTNFFTFSSNSATIECDRLKTVARVCRKLIERVA